MGVLPILKTLNHTLKYWKSTFMRGLSRQLLQLFHVLITCNFQDLSLRQIHALSHVAQTLKLFVPVYRYEPLI